MNFKMNFLTTTTDLLEGYKILNYLGTVSAHVVTGTGFFSDFSAGLSDVFGGRSMAYQKQLVSIKNEVLDNLKNEARKIGANGVIGLTIDFDEISGKGKTMFMVTAMGTAVRIERSTGCEKTEEIENVLTSDTMKLELNINSCLEMASKNTLKLDEKTWAFIIENRIEELGGYILEKLNSITNIDSQLTSGDEQIDKYAKEYFLSINSDAAKKYMYQAIRLSNKIVINLACHVINELDLVDLDEILSMLDSDELNIKKRAIILLKYSKRNYTAKDILQYLEIKNKLSICFKEVGERFTKKQMLSSKENGYWKCACGEVNQNDNEKCERCGKNIYGFMYNEYKPADGIKLVDDKINILKKYFETGVEV